MPNLGPLTPAIGRVLDRCVETADGCWQFTGYLMDCGYGQVRAYRRTYLTHRVTYEHFVGEIPDGLVIDHLCRNRACCNPWHLEAVPQRLNVLRGEGPLTAGAWRAEVESAKTHCPRGHAYDVENTYLTRQGHRHCRACKRISQRAYEARKKALTHV